MGTSKIIIGLGVYIMIGFFCLMAINLNKNNNTTILSEVYNDQAYQIAQCGIAFGLNQLEISSTQYFSEQVNIFNGSVSYVIDKPSNILMTERRITSQGSYQNHSMILVSILKKSQSKWYIDRLYQIQDSTEYQKLGYF